MTPDDVMLRRRERPPTPEEDAAFAPGAEGPRLPDPMPYVAFREMKDRKTAVEIGLKGTF